jgi:ABC-type sugar transport system ATPase subunit
MSTGNGSGSALLEVEGVSKRYGGIQAVADGNLRVERAEMMGLVGPNGCGKSTMLNVVSGVVTPDSGSVVFDGQPLPTGHYRATQKRGVLLVAQELALAPLDTVWESVVLGSEPVDGGFFINRRRARKMAAAALETLGHDLPLDARVGTLSPVERRLVMIARGAAHPHVRLLILDEPTAGLPHEEAARVIDAMKKLIDSDRSLVLVSHHIEDIVSACRKVTLMRDGRTYRTLEGGEVNKDGIVRLLLASVSEMVSHEPETARAAAAGGEEVAVLDDVRGTYLNGVSFNVRRGEVVGIAGILGSGASEVVQLLTGQHHPLGGRVAVGAKGINPSSPHKSLHHGVGFISGDRANLVIKSMTVSEHVALPALNKLTTAGLVSKRKERNWVEESLTTLSVKGAPGAPMTSLSGGNQQRALMSRWSNLKVDLLVVETPTVGVDLAGRKQILEVLSNVARERDQGVVIASEADELATISDRVICLRRGEVAAELTGADITEEKILSEIS